MVSLRVKEGTSKRLIGEREFLSPPPPPPPPPPPSLIPSRSTHFYGKENGGRREEGSDYEFSLSLSLLPKQIYVPKVTAERRRRGEKCLKKYFSPTDAKFISFFNDILTKSVQMFDCAFLGLSRSPPNLKKKPFTSYLLPIFCLSVPPPQPPPPPLWITNKRGHM